MRKRIKEIFRISVDGQVLREGTAEYLYKKTGISTRIIRKSASEGMKHGVFKIEKVGEVKVDRSYTNHDISQKKRYRDGLWRDYKVEKIIEFSNTVDYGQKVMVAEGSGDNETDLTVWKECEIVGLYPHIFVVDDGICYQAFSYSDLYFGLGVKYA